MPPQAPGRRPQPQMPQAPGRRPARLPAPVKREVSETDGRRSKLRVYSEAEQDEIGIATLLGEYTEQGVNHGHPTYQKVLENQEEVNVFVYFWDTRDGTEFSGWWFGDSVGGQQVWSRSVETGKGKVPPSRGWRVPWDADVVDGLLIVEVADSMAQPVSNGPSPPSKPPAAHSAPSPTRPGPLIKPKVQPPDDTQSLMAERIKLATDRVVAAEAEVEQVIASARKTLSSQELEESSVLEVDTVLRAQLETVQSEQKQLAKDLTESRAARCSSTALGELARLMPRLRGSLCKVEGELQKVKTSLQKVRSDAALAKKKAEEQESAAEAEQRDARALQAALPEAMEVVTGAEDAVETVAILAAAMSADDDVDTSEAHQIQAIQDIETSASKASNDLMEARKLVSNRLRESNKKYAPEAKKVAQQEFEAMEKRLGEASKRLQPLKKFRQEFEQKIAAKKALQEIQNKLNSAELEIEKAHIMTSSTDTQMEQDDITSTSQMLEPAEEDLKATFALINQRSPPMQDTAAQKELEGMKKRVSEAREKLMSIREVLKRQQETLQVDGTLSLVHEKIEHAEEAFLATSEAEMPFLKGLEVLPVEEGVQAVAQCEAAIQKCEAALENARSYIKKVEAESKNKFSKEAFKHLFAELGKCRSRGEDTEKKLVAFRKETRQRKAKGMVQEVSEKVVEAENQSQALAEVVQVLHTDNLDSVTVDSLKAAFEQSVAAEKEAVRAYNDARNIITAKQKEVKEQPVLSELSKLQKRLAAAHQEMIKSRQLAKGGDALIKGKKVVNEEEKKVIAMEQAVEKVEKQIPSEEQEVNKEDLLALDGQIKAAIAAVQSGQRSLEQATVGASTALKNSLNELLVRVKDASTRVDKAKQASKTQREKATAEVFAKEAEQQVEHVEAALVKVAEAELPFLKGIEVLPLSEASTAIAECEQAAKQVQEALEKAKGFVNTKVLEVQRFAEAAAKPCLERLNGLVERNNAAASKLAQFRKDTESHKRTSQMQEAEEMLNAAEAEVEKTKEAGAPLAAEDLSSITSQTGTEICENIASLEKAANKKVNDALVFLAQRRQDVRGTPQEKHLEQLQARLGKIKASLGEAKKQASQQEQRFVSRKLQTEGAELVNEVETEVKKTEAAAEPLLRSSSFLVRGNVQRLSGMVQDVIGKGSSKDKLFKQACGELEHATPATFQAFVTWMVENNALDSVSEGFLESEVEAMFRHLDKDNKGHLTEQQFQDIFSDQFACVQPVSMTENFSISDGKSVMKLDVGVAVEALGMPQYDEQQKLTRLRCRLLEDVTKEGWVTTKGNQGKVFLDRLSPHSANQKSFERMISSSSKVVNKAASFLTARRKELTDCSSGPLLEARVKMDEFRVKVSAFQRTVEEIKRKVGEAAKEYEKCEQEQRKARVDARDQRLLDSFSKGIEEQVKALKVEQERINQVVAPLSNGADLEALDAPMSILKDGREMADALKEQLATARKSIQQHEMPSNVRAGTQTSMQKVIDKAVSQVESTLKDVNAMIKAVSSSALKLAEAVLRKTQLALRQEALRKEKTLEALFSEVAQDADTVPRKELVRWLGSLSDLNLSPEQVSLMMDRIAGSDEEGVVSRWTFLRKFQQFFECQKNIALTHDVVITNSKPIRMLQAEEVLEVLDGPRSEQKSGIERVRARAMRDNSVGWVSLSGNQGSVFLKERPKPFVSCQLPQPLEKSFQSTGEAPIRTLKMDEVLEILEGPRQDLREAVTRVRCRTIKDQLEGWVTLSSGSEVQAQAGQQRFWCCKTGVAVTDGPNIKECKVLRKMEVGEMLRLLEGPEIDKDSGVTRLKAHFIKDKLEGWITTMGNAGTVYAEEKTEIYSVMCEALPLQKSVGELSWGAGTLRMLEKDEAFEVLEGPKEFQPDPVERMKGRAISDGQVGWVTCTTKRLKRWYPSYICKEETAMQSSLSTGSALVRKVDVGELLEVLDGPHEDKDAGLLRIKAKARRDQAVGWITVKGSQGSVFLTQWSRKDEEQLKQKQKSLQEGLGKET